MTPPDFPDAGVSESLERGGCLTSNPPWEGGTRMARPAAFRATRYRHRELREAFAELWQDVGLSRPDLEAVSEGW